MKNGKEKKCCGIQCSKIVETGKVVNVAKARVCHIPCSRRHLGFADHIHYGAYQGSIRASLIVNLDG